MNFLKKHYEKVILLSLFIIFALLLVHLYTIIQATSEVKDSDLQIPTREPDYKLADLTQIEFKLPELFKDNIQWQPSTARDEKSGDDFSDIMAVFKITRCGYCNRLIPRSYMEKSLKCPYFDCTSKEALKPPKKEQEGDKNAGRLDSDEDGIPNLVELVYGLNPYNADDALLDLDDDGFVNFYEYQMMKDSDEFTKIFSEEGKNFTNEESKQLILKDPKKHPELYLGLKVERVDRQPLNMELLGITVENSKSDRSGWPIQIKIKEQYIGTGRKRKLQKEKTNVLYIGEKIKLETGTYTIDAIKSEPIPEAKRTRESGDTNYYIILRKSNSKDKSKDILFEVKKGVEAYDPEYRAHFAEVWSDKKYNGRANGSIRMGNSNVGFSKYTIKEINERNKTVTLETADKKRIVIKDSYLMPEEAQRAFEKNKNDSKKGDAGNTAEPSGTNR